jgi:acyl carrier protein
VFNLIKKTILEFVDIDENTIKEDSYFVRDLHMTSYDVVCIIGKLEDDLGIEILDREIRDFETIGELDQYLTKKLL